MRDIKFRGKNGEKWIYGNLLAYKASGIFWAKIWEHNEDGSLGDQSDVYISSVGQYTGMHDKNGKEIYEGDILYHNDGIHETYGTLIVRIGDYNNTENYPYSVEYNGVYLHCTEYGDVPLSCDNTKYFEVIGNLYDDAVKCTLCTKEE